MEDGSVRDPWIQYRLYWSVDPAANENAGGATANFNSGTFGRITTQAGDPRIVQLGIKYSF